MKLVKLWFFILTSLAIAGMAFGQPGAVDITYFDDGSGTYPPLGCVCTSGTPYEDGTSICVYWDNDNNGPDPDDPLTEVGTGYGQVNNPCGSFNGEVYGLPGFFQFDPLFIVNEVPGGDSAKYYLRISSPAVAGGDTCCWTSSVFTVVPGPQEFYPTPSNWTCTNDPCVITGGDPPVAPTDFTASDDTGCLSITCRWRHNRVNVQQFRVERFRLDGTGWNTLATVNGTDTVASFTVATDAVRQYRVSAVNVNGDAASNTDNGSAYLLRFAPGANGNLTGMNLHGSTHTIQFVRPTTTCASGAKLYLVHSDSANGVPVQWGLLASCSLCTQIQFTLPSNTTLNYCKLVLQDSSFLYSTIFTDTTDSIFHLGIPDAADIRDLVLPDRFDLAQNFPNPFNPETQIVFNVPATADVRINVYNINGQLVRTLIDGRYSIGTHQVTWDGRNNAGQIVSAGLYLYRMEAPGYMQTKKMLLMK
ncbi:MAG: FlgD immunoglobulin-like domain containing protein [Calditrichota bacterium]